MVTITTLIENLVYQRGLVAEHGLSFHINDGHTNILFDTGQGGNFIANAKKLGIDISAVDYVVISHGHFDHIGGLPEFFKSNSRARVYLKEEALKSKYHAKSFIGLENIPESNMVSFNYVQQIIPLSENVYVIPQIQSYFKNDSHKQGFFIKYGVEYVPDSFEDELFIVIITDNKLHILSSCSHNGITNIVETARQYFHLPVGAVIGGFHTKNDNPENIKQIINYFNNSGIEQIGISHCTGVSNFEIFKAKCHANVYYNYTGTQITI